MAHTTNRSELRSDADCLALVTDIVETAAAYEAACETLRRDVGDYIEACAKLPVDWLDGSGPARRAIAERVLHRLEADGHGLLAEWRNRVLHGTDQASFWTMVKTVVRFVAIGYAQSAERRDVRSPVRRRRSR
jgi:hypothetical protein